MRLAPPVDARAAVLQKVWLQTWLAGSTRQDRATFRFRSTGPTISVELPPEVVAESVEVLLDGQEAETETGEVGRMTVLLPASSGRRIRTLELRYWRESTRAALATSSWTPPLLVGATPSNQVRWHIVLPSHMHLIRWPEHLSSVRRRQWFPTRWGSRPLFDQPDLERWIGATAQLPPSPNENQYLLSGVSQPGSIELVTARRWLIVLVASGIVLTLGLACMYFPAMRSRGLLLVGSVLIAALSVIFPGPALLLGQAAVWGVFLIVVAIVLHRSVLKQPQRKRFSSGSTASMLRPASTGDALPMQPVSVASSNAPTVSLRTSDSPL